MTAALSKAPLAIGIAAGGLIGAGSALGVDKLFGGRPTHGQELADARVLKSQYERELTTGREDGNLTVRREAELEQLIDGQQDKIGVNYTPALLSTAALGLWPLGTHLDEKTNFSTKIQPGFESSGYSLGLFNSADKVVLDQRLRFTSGPPALKAAAIAIPTVVLGAALAHQILE